MLGVFTFVVALFVSTALIPPLTYAAAALGLIDLPDSRKVHTGAIPRIGGIGIIAGVLTPILMWVPVRPDILAYVIGVLILAIFGVWDDRKNIDYRLKFLGQFLAVLIVVFYGGVVVDRVPFVAGGELPAVFAIPFTVVLLVGITNAINLSDGLDGLAGGTTLLAIACLVVLAYLAEDPSTMLIGLAVIGAITGFLRFNSFPARVFMGDTGSQFLGFTAGVLAVIVTDISNRAISPVLPVLILGLPIFDTLWVMAQRISAGRSPFAPDRNHIHYKLLDLGYSHYEAVIVIYTVQALLVSAAYLLRYSWDELILALYLAFCLAIIVFFRVASSRHWQQRRNAGQNGWIHRLISYVTETGIMSKAPYVFIQWSVPAFLITGALFATAVPLDFAIFGTLLLVILLVAFWIATIPFNMLERLGTYATAAFVAYLLQTSFGAGHPCALCIHLFFGLLAIVIAVWVRFTGKRAFRVSGLDFLIVFIAVVVPNIPGFMQQDSVLGAVALQSIILFYASEVLLSQHARYWDMLRFSTLVTLAIMGLRGLL